MNPNTSFSSSSFFCNPLIFFFLCKQKEKDKGKSTLEKRTY